ncbi:acetyl-CoA carboxylase, carboxyltransferase subunit beta [Clostridiaceae bacterium M8S5]|nr:acetyl-CoA carboxylase, carboxyltransferase subunit beta [Clostridiaceae bacterium M8S5]
MLNKIFKKNKYSSMNITNMDKRREETKVPDGMWEKCKKCGIMIYKDNLKAQQMVCASCNNHMRMSARDRIDSILDKNSFIELDSDMNSVNPLEFNGYKEKVQKSKEKSKINEAVITGQGTIDNNATIICVMDSNFMMGSMGSVVGEKLTRAIEIATENRLPVIIFSASGGARMQEGIFSLMQMVKTSAALSRHNQAGLLYISVLTDPTTGGVSASFAMQGDIILAEPGAVIGFAGRRVIEQTIRQKLPEEFQTSEFLLEHGFIDKIVLRKDMRKTLAQIIAMHKEVL